jgi:hypothetical protein
LLPCKIKEEAVVPRRSKIRISKTRIRHHFRHLAQYGVDEIELFREHLHEGRAARQRALKIRAESLPPEAQELLAEEVSELDIISTLANQLSIVALYRVVEINTGHMLAHEFGKAAAKKASDVNKLETLLKNKKGIELAHVPHYRAIKELRELNNEIKHADQNWNETKNLYTLHKAYARLRVKVPAYIFRLAERMKLRYR